LHRRVRERGIDLLDIGIASADKPSADQDVLQIIEAFFTQQRISCPGVLLEVTRHGARADLRFDIGERRRDELGDRFRCVLCDPLLGSVKSPSEAV
jgi:hypothetical protein